jgi:GT2 family glycosyltransferase
MPVKLSIIVPTHNRPDSLVVALDSLLPHVANKDAVAVFVIDDASDAGNKQKNYHCCTQRDIYYSFIDTRGGPSGARMKGVEISQSEWVAFLDDDVCVVPSWFDSLWMAMSSASPDIVGIEGRITAGESGVWDTEVENRRGGLYLTGNIAYRRAALCAAGGFDPSFSGPFCEDQELAARMLERGKIVFAPNVAVVHQPRPFHPLRYITQAPGRILCLLESEKYFYSKHPHAYGRFRYAKTFSGTYRNVVLKQVYISFKRRKGGQLVRYPVQTLVLFLTSVLEQISALIFPFYYMVTYRQKSRNSYRQDRQ